MLSCAVKLYESSEEFSVYCSTNDTCKIGCFNENACRYLDLYCYGNCLVDCDDGSNYQCPTIKVGTYSVWKNNNQTVTAINESYNGNGIADGTDEQNGKNVTVFAQLVSAFILTLMLVSCCLATIICVCRCICATRKSGGNTCGTANGDRVRLMKLYFVILIFVFS